MRPVIFAALAVLLVIGIFSLQFVDHQGKRSALKVDKSPVKLQIGADRFLVPLNYVFPLMAPLTQKQPEIRFTLYYPDFVADSGDARPRFSGSEHHIVDHLLLVSLMPLAIEPFLSFDEMKKNLSEQGIPIAKLKPSPFDLLEIYDSLTPNNKVGAREFLGSIDGLELLISCQDPGLAPPPSSVVYFCQFNFPFGSLNVNVQFGQSSLEDWQNLYRRTLSLLLKFEED